MLLKSSIFAQNSLNVKKMHLEIFKTKKPQPNSSSSVKLGPSVRRQGFEPWTPWLRVRCSTNWASGAYFVFRYWRLPRQQLVLYISAKQNASTFFIFLQFFLLFPFLPFTPISKYHTKPCKFNDLQPIHYSGSFVFSLLFKTLTVTKSLSHTHHPTKSSSLQSVSVANPTRLWQPLRLPVDTPPSPHLCPSENIQP